MSGGPVVGNDPINNTDPSGKFLLNAIGAIVNAGIEVAIIAAEGDVSFGEAALRVGVAAGSGALGVGVGSRVATLAAKGVRALSSTARTARTGTAGSLAARGAAGGAASSAVAEGGLQTNQAITGNGFDGGEVLEAATIGAAVGGTIGGTIDAVATKVHQSVLTARGSTALVRNPEGALAVPGAQVGAVLQTNVDTIVDLKQEDQ